MKNLKKLREQYGLTQKEMADILQIQRPSYTRYENNERQPDNDTLRMLANYFDVSIDYLLGYESESQEITHARKVAQNLYTECSDLDIDLIEKKLGVNYATFKSWIDGLGNYFNDKLFLIADLFNVSVDYLLGRETQQSIDKQLKDEQFALWGEVRDLTEAEKQDVLDFIKFKKSQRDTNS